MNAVVTSADGQIRCHWCDATEQYRHYHDHEWGFPVGDDLKLFEMLSLEAFQSGLSWRTILERREGFRQGFVGFEPEQLSRWGEPEVLTLLEDTGIIRHRGKIEATLNNAVRLQELIDREGSFAAWLWSFEPSAAKDSMATAVELSAALKRRGWKFVGPTTLHSFIQAMGLVNDHATLCHVYKAAEAARDEFVRPRQALADPFAPDPEM